MMNRERTALSSSNGFTLIELMIVIVIVGILALVAFPNYRDSVLKAHRADAQQYMMTLAQADQQYLIDNRAYTDQISALATTPSSVSTYYTLAITVSAGPPPSFSITAAPIGAQTSDTCGTLTLANAGTKSSSSGTNCW